MLNLQETRHERFLNRERAKLVMETFGEIRSIESLGQEKGQEVSLDPILLVDQKGQRVKNEQ